jgi:hypothetical protein
MTGFGLVFVGPELFILFDAKKPENLFDRAVSFLKLENDKLSYEVRFSRQTDEHLPQVPLEIDLF